MKGKNRYTPIDAVITPSMTQCETSWMPSPGPFVVPTSRAPTPLAEADTLPQQFRVLLQIIPANFEVPGSQIMRLRANSMQGKKTRARFKSKGRRTTLKVRMRGPTARGEPSAQPIYRWGAYYIFSRENEYKGIQKGHRCIPTKAQGGK